jgi:RNA polymerase sigma factor (sigma-70 family)
MSTVDVRRYRAEQLASAHYTRLQMPVASFVRAKLGRSADRLPEPELEASYNMAWSALMQRVVEGNAPSAIDGWLCVVTYRRAIDYLRRHHTHREVSLTVAEEFATDENAHEIASSGESLQILSAALQRRFGSRGAHILACVWIADLPHADAAAQVGVSTKRLRKILYGDDRKIGLRDELRRLLRPPQQPA